MFKRGFLRCFWECGGGFVVLVMKSGVFYEVLVFIALKFVGGGAFASTFLGNLGIEVMYDVLLLFGVCFEIYGCDIFICGYVLNLYSMG